MKRNVSEGNKPNTKKIKNQNLQRNKRSLRFLKLNEKEEREREKNYNIGETVSDLLSINDKSKNRIRILM